MRTWHAGALALGLLGSGTGEAAPPSKIVALELFTSQGCSSCPPADRVFEDLANDPQLPGGVVPLAFHVPYWNHLGWRDPFSSGAFEQRQREYAAALRSKQLYTPQLVVNGKAHRVGPHDRATMDQIVNLAARPVPGRLRLEVERKARELTVTTSVSLTEDLGPGAYELVAVAFHHPPSTPVPLGENSGSELANAWTVRAMARVARGAGTKGTTIGGEVTLRMPDDMAIRDVGVAALLQDRATREVVHAGRLEVPRGKS